MLFKNITYNLKLMSRSLNFFNYSQHPTLHFVFFHILYVFHYLWQFALYVKNSTLGVYYWYIAGKLNNV